MKIDLMMTIKTPYVSLSWGAAQWRTCGAPAGRWSWPWWPSCPSPRWCTRWGWGPRTRRCRSSGPAGSYIAGERNSECLRHNPHRRQSNWNLNFLCCYIWTISAMLFTDVDNIFLASPAWGHCVQSHGWYLLILSFEKEKNVQIPRRNKDPMKEN